MEIPLIVLESNRDSVRLSDKQIICNLRKGSALTNGLVAKYEITVLSAIWRTLDQSLQDEQLLK